MGTMDQGFVPAPPRRVYARLADPATYPEWWPGARAGAGTVTVPGFSRSEVTVSRARPGIGLILRFGSDGTAGSLEWYLESFKDGTIVNAILELDRGAERRRMRMRRGIRDALVALRAMAEAP